MNKRTKIILGISIIFAVILVALLILLAIVKGKNISVKPPIETEESESGEVEININRDNLDEFGKVYYDNIYECAYLTIDCTFSGDCFLDDDYFAKAYSNSNKEDIQFTGYITPEGAEITYADTSSFLSRNVNSVYINNKGVFFNLTHLEGIYRELNKEKYPFGSLDNYFLQIESSNYSGFDIKALILDAILNSNYVVGTVGENRAISITGGFKSSYDNYLGRFLNKNFNEDMVITLTVEGDFGNRVTTMVCDGQTYSFVLTFSENPHTKSSFRNDEYTVFNENELNTFISEIRTVFGESAYEYLD